MKFFLWQVTINKEMKYQEEKKKLTAHMPEKKDKFHSIRSIPPADSGKTA